MPEEAARQRLRHLIRSLGMDALMLPEAMRILRSLEEAGEHKEPGEPQEEESDERPQGRSGCS